MRKRCVVALLALLLSGCGAQETFETISDEQIQPVSAEMREILVDLPADAASPVSESEAGRMYQCGDYDIYCQTVSAGDLDATVRTLCGFGRDGVTIVETLMDGCKRYDFVWACAGETGERLGRAAILDDGNYHYCLSVLADAETAGEIKGVWQEIFDSFGLA